MATTIDKLINEAIIECSDLKDSAKVGMDNLSNTYVNYLLPQYAKAVELAKSFTKNNQKVLETFSKPLWPQSDALALLSANISNYTNSITNYTDLSKMLTGHYSTWLEQTFSVRYMILSRMITSFDSFYFVLV